APAASTCSIWADPERLVRAVEHVIQNAVEAAGPAGRVDVFVLYERGAVAIEVLDDGPGMSAEFVRDRLFRPFETTKEEGMGIGMHESRAYLREIGGEIEVESEPGTGTRMRIRLPTAEAFSADEGNAWTATRS